MSPEKYTGFVVLFFLFLQGFAQQEIVLKPLKTDTMDTILQRQAEYRQLITGQAPEGFMSENFEFPEFDFNSNFTPVFNSNFDRYFTEGIPADRLIPGIPPPFFSPFYGNATLLSQGMYQINSKFSMGGYSYGVNSPFSAPLPNSFGKFDRYGTTLFMQYKVSKNIKIETRVNVSQGGAYQGF